MVACAGKDKGKIGPLGITALHCLQQLSRPCLTVEDSESGRPPGALTDTENPLRLQPAEHVRDIRAGKPPRLRWCEVIPNHFLQSADSLPEALAITFREGR